MLSFWEKLWLGKGFGLDSIPTLTLTSYANSGKLLKSLCKNLFSENIGIIVQEKDLDWRGFLLKLILAVNHGHIWVQP